MTVHLADKRRKVTHRLAATYEAHNRGWISVYATALRTIRVESNAGARWVIVTLPFPFFPDMKAAYARVLARAACRGYERRPGGPSGLAYDLVMLERTA